jgi:squamous cell carcinoma antigen recognized by T-cells 3
LLQEAGKLLLRGEPVRFMGVELKPEEEGASAKKGPMIRKGAPAGATDMFIPRVAGSRPRAGLGMKKKPGSITASSVPSTVSNTVAEGSVGSSATKGQDDFRKLLGGK